jgi:hypothetical protein
MQPSLRKNIVLNVDMETAELFEKASEQKRKKLGFMFAFLMREPLHEDFFLHPEEKGWDDLNRRLDKISREAEIRGLTPQLLEEILKK